MSELREKIARFLLTYAPPKNTYTGDFLSWEDAHSLRNKYFEDADYILSLMREEDGWRPIESAPKDGTEIITVRMGEEDSYEIQHWFSIERTAYVEVGDGLFKMEKRPSYEGWSQNGHRATHWRPLPAPPAALLNALENDNG